MSRRGVGPSTPPPGRRAVAYLRMSTAEQTQSLAHQALAIGAYAATHGYELVRTYEDAGVSGVGLRGRSAFRTLLATVLGGRADFEAILIYDISRWGRFQDPDEAAHYEFLCGEAGVELVYCAEPFTGRGDLAATLIKGLKRVMAAEYSRELGVKVAAAQARRAAEGRWQHGRPGYGLRRRVVCADGTLGPVLEAGERRSRRGDGTVLAAGPRSEVAVVRRIYRMFLDEGATLAAMARTLNAEGVAAEAGAAWTPLRVRQVLSNPKYAGDLVTQRRHTPLGGRRRWRDRADWICADGATPRLVSARRFAAAQRRLDRPALPDDEMLLARLAAVAEVHGVIGEGRLRQLGEPHWRAYRDRFGSLRAAFARAGHEAPARLAKRLDDTALLAGLARLHLACGEVTTARIAAHPDLPNPGVYARRFGSLAAALKRIGYVRIPPAEQATPVGAARAEALARRLRAWLARSGLEPAAAHAG